VRGKEARGITYGLQDVRDETGTCARKEGERDDITTASKPVRCKTLVFGQIVSSQRVGEDGVFAGGGAARKHPAPPFTEMIRHIDVNNNDQGGNKWKARS
jgi:hypothetical protein